MAKQAGIYRDGSGWSKYPEDMLRARVISRAVRSVYPACILGHYATEEVMDFDPPKHMCMVEEVKAPIEVIEDTGGDYPLILPDGQVYSSFHTPEGWIAGYAELASKVMQSAKLTDEQRSEKISALAAANQDITAHFSSFDKIKIKAELSKVGVTLNPKPPASPLGADLEHNEPIF